MIHQLLRFGVVGTGAMLLHWLIVIALVPFGIPPLVANIIGFTGAFQLSYWGHRHWTFKASALSHRQTLLRFIMVACSSFMLNEAMYFVLLSYTTLDYRLALIIVLITVAALTYLLSRQWAFRHP